jgi:hypothetical protein
MDLASAVFVKYIFESVYFLLNNPVFGDEAFPLKIYLMKHYRQLNHETLSNNECSITGTPELVEYQKTASVCSFRNFASTKEGSNKLLNTQIK